LALSICGAGLARNFRVIVRPGWTEPSNIFTVTALLSGERKSKVFRDALAPVHAHEQAERERLAPIIAELQSEHRALEATLKHLETKIAKETDPEERGFLKAESKKVARELLVH